MPSRLEFDERNIDSGHLRVMSAVSKHSDIIVNVQTSDQSVSRLYQQNVFAISKDQSDTQRKETEFEPMKPKLKIIYKGLQNVKEFVPTKLKLNRPILKKSHQNEIQTKS